MVPARPILTCLPPMVTRAANLEDVILRRVLQDVEAGFYIDIGAARPIHGSVTAWFYQAGWRGLNVEPDPGWFGELERLRTRDINLQRLGTTIDHVLDQAGDVTVDFLRVHVEGLEREVFEAASLDRSRPRLVLLAATQAGSPSQRHEDWESALLSKRYEFAYFDGLNRFYVRE